MSAVFNTKAGHAVRLLALSPLLLAILSAYAAEDQAATPAAAVPAAQPAEAKKAAPQAPAPAKAGDGKLQQVEVKGSVQSYDERRNDTATKIVVTQEEILKNGDTNISEVLKRLPGITIGGVQGRGGEIRMRGLGNGYTSIMLNGEPAPPGFSLDSISPDMIERVEIMRAATAEFSTQAVAGAINVVLKKAVQTGQREIKVGVQEDNGHYGGSVNLQMSDRKGPLSYSLAGGMTEAYFNRQPSVLTESIEDPNGALISQRNTLTGNHGRFEALNLSPRVNLALGPGETLTSQSFVNVNNFTGFNTENITTKVGVLPQFSNNNLGVVSKFEMARTDLNWVKKLAEGAKIDVKFGVNWNHRVNNVDSMLGDISSALLLDRKVDSSASDKGFTTVGKYSTPYAQDHALAFGWDAGVSQRGEDRIEHDFTPAGVQSGFISEVYDASVKRVAVFTQDEWNVTPRWSVYFGLRWEGLDTTSEGNTYASVHNKSSVWSPLFQTLWKLPDTKADQVRLGLTRTYKAPATNTLIPRRFIATNNSVNTPDSQGNPNLKPELALGLDASYEHFLPDGGLLSASTYVRRIQDITRRSLNLINGLWVAMPINDGVAMTRGIELEAKMPLRSLDKTLPAIDMRANMSRNWSTIDTVPGPNNRLDQQTPFSANIGADWKLDSLPLTLGGNFNIQTGGPVRISDKQFTYTAAKRSLDMYALWKFTAQNQLRVSLANMLHQNNITENDYVDTFGSSQAVTLTPTNVIVRAQLEIKF